MSAVARSFCPSCGFGVATDEDGCCASCGAPATGVAVDGWLAARKVATDAARTLEEIDRLLVEDFGDYYLSGPATEPLGRVRALLRGDHA